MKSASKASTGLKQASNGLNGARRMPAAQLARLKAIALRDSEGLASAHEKYGDSWRKRGGGEAYHNLTRKWDRIERAVEAVPSQDVFAAIVSDAEAHKEGLLAKDGLLDDVRDLRRYLLLVEEFATRSQEQL